MDFLVECQLLKLKGGNCWGFCLASFCNILLLYNCSFWKFCSQSLFVQAFVILFSHIFIHTLFIFKIIFIIVCYESPLISLKFVFSMSFEVSCCRITWSKGNSCNKIRIVLLSTTFRIFAVFLISESNDVGKYWDFLISGETKRIIVIVSWYLTHDKVEILSHDNRIWSYDNLPFAQFRTSFKMATVA